MKKLMLLVAALAFTAVTVAQEPVKKVEKKAKVEKTQILIHIMHLLLSTKPVE